MKRILLITASLVVAVSSFGQGTVSFQNYIAGTLQALEYNVNPTNPFEQKHGQTAQGVPSGTQTYSGAALAGTGFTVQLWGIAGSGHTEAELGLLPGATTSYRTGGGAGRIAVALLQPPALTDGQVPVPGAPLGATAQFGTFQIRAWDNLGGTITSWATVVGNPAIPRGFTEVVSAGPLGGTGTPTATPAFLTGITSFQLFIVPEPSAIALGALGLGTLMFLRRRK